jgi:site-specific DNA recombinase
MRAALYARRSTSDRDERQVQSIEDQVRIMTAKAGQEGLLVAEEITESKSAKEPYVRPEFERMLKLLDSGKVDSILCWHLNRLFRNSVDMSAIQWRLQKGIIRKIVTPDRVYLPEDNVLLFYMEAGVSNQTVLDLSKAVKRGMGSKVRKGWFPHRAPAGYLNNKFMEKGDKTISRDPERFDLLRKAWDLMLTGSYTVPQIQKILNEEWHYRSYQYKRAGGGPMARNTLYQMFSNVFYAGYFVEKGEIHQGAHEPMVTLREFQRVQQLLGREHHIQPQKRQFAYTGMIHCTRCGGQVTAQVTTKKSGKTYTYYFCQNLKRTCRKAGVREEQLEHQIDELLAQMTTLPEFNRWGEQTLGDWRKAERAVEHAAYNQALATLSSIDGQLDNLLTLKVKELITDEEYVERKTKLLNERILLRRETEETETAADQARQAVENVLIFAGNVRGWFACGDSAIRRAIAHALASNVAFTEGKVGIAVHPLLRPIQEGYKDLEVKYLEIKLDETKSESEKKQALEPVRSAWSRMLDNIQTLALHDSLFFPKIPASSSALASSVSASSASAKSANS